MGELITFPEFTTARQSRPIAGPVLVARGGADVVGFRHVDVEIVAETIRVLRLIDDSTLLDTFNRRTTR